MRIFEIVKENVNLREAAELYGIDVNRYGKALCSFHNDRHPSLYVADDHYYCFACGEHGDVIDFVGRLFQLSPYDAARKLMADFHLSPDKPPSAAAIHAKHIRTEAQQLMENERLCFSVLSDYARVLRDWKVSLAAIPIFFLRKRNKNKGERTVRMNGDLPLRSQGGQPGNGAVCRCSFCISELYQHPQ